ncbi:hypothetical protein CV102_25665 [Natronococcus pandeyae]|uniref:Uncharacterized protein n=2 Tax=Natronococcus pandeyae TaxID=2055836 RepID=A0A8J8TN23_9EURY|nr:hypothetical protein CV102_25665 [Natronococcus pandeyae]
MTNDELPHRRVKPDDPVPEVIWCLIDSIDENQLVGTFLTRKAAKEKAVAKAKERDLSSSDFPVAAVHYKDIEDIYNALGGGIREDVLVPTSEGFDEYREFMDTLPENATDSDDN